MKKKSIEHFIDMREHMSRVLHKPVFLVNTIIINIEFFFFCIFNLLMMIVNVITLIFRCCNDKNKRERQRKKEEKNERKSRKNKNECINGLVPARDNS